MKNHDVAHAPEPWKIPEGETSVYGNDGSAVHSFPKGKRNAANAWRMKLCVNALAGSTNEEIEALASGRLREVLQFVADNEKLIGAMVDIRRAAVMAMVSLELLEKSSGRLPEHAAEALGVLKVALEKAGLKLEAVPVEMATAPADIVC